jgi:hypothetical protein
MNIWDFYPLGKLWNYKKMRAATASRNVTPMEISRHWQFSQYRRTVTNSHRFS